MLNLKKVKKNGQNYIRKFTERHNIKLFYDCECGKRYDTFPALYLHFQRKHQRKISTKKEFNEYEVEEKSDSIVVTYFYSKCNGQGFEEKISINNFSGYLLRNTIQTFQSSFLKEVEPQKTPLVQRILRIFEEHLEAILRMTKDVEERKLLNDIPIFLNSFISEAVGKKIQLRNYNLLCKILGKLCKWLKQNSYTQFEVEYIGFEDERKNENT